MEPKDMDEVLRHTTPTTLRVQEHLRPETKALIVRANQLLAIWQEQEAAQDRGWDEEKVAHAKYIALIESDMSIAHEIRDAYRNWKTVVERTRSLPSYFEPQREWFDLYRKATKAITEDAGLLRSEEDKKYDKPEDPVMPSASIVLRQVPVLDDAGIPAIDPETNEPMEKTEVDYVATALANPKIVEKFSDALQKVAEKLLSKKDPDAK